MHLVAVHARHVEALGGCRRHRAWRSRRRAWRRSGSRRRPARIARPGRATSTLSMKASGNLARTAGHRTAGRRIWSTPQLRQLGQLVAQGGDAGRRQFGLAVQRRRSSRADAARRSARSWARRGAAPRCSAAPAWPGGRGARRRNCRWSARRPARSPGGGSLGRSASRADRYLFDSSCVRRAGQARMACPTRAVTKTGYIVLYSCREALAA